MAYDLFCGRIYYGGIIKTEITEDVMATWISHLRIADYFMTKLQYLNEKEFVIGHIGPDCGMPNEDWSLFTPDRKTTHWLEGESGKEIGYDSFYQKHLAEGGEDLSFYLGYYMHLMADHMWMEIIGTGKKEKYRTELAQDKGFIWEMKKDWYDLDFQFIQNNPGLPAIDVFYSVDEFENRFLDYFPPEAITSRIKYIQDFYDQEKDLANREYVYLTEDEINEYVEKTIESIERDLHAKSILQ